MRNKSIALVLLILLVSRAGRLRRRAPDRHDRARRRPLLPQRPSRQRQPRLRLLQPTATTATSRRHSGHRVRAPARLCGKTYVLVPKNLGNPYFDTANKGAQEAAKELGVTVTYQGPATADATQQIQLINSLIAQNVNGLAISADDSDALVAAGKSAIERRTSRW